MLFLGRATIPMLRLVPELLYRSLAVKLVVSMPFKHSILVRVELEKAGRQSRASCSVHDLLGHGQSHQIDHVAGFGQRCVCPVVGAH